jgi:hypothetical protein
LDPPDLLGAIASYHRGLAQAREIGDRFEVAQCLLSIVGVTLRLGLDSADAALSEAIAYTYELRYWPTLWTLFGYAAGHLAVTGRRYAAGVLAGYLEANQPHVITLIERSAIAAGVALDGVSGPEAQQGRSDGVDMDRNRIVMYVLSMLSAEGQQPAG